MVSLINLPKYQTSPLLDLSPINDGLDTYARGQQVAKANERADKQMAMQEKQFSAQQQDRLRKLIAGRAQMIIDEPDDAKASAVYQRHFSSPEIMSAIKENGLDPADFRGVAKAFHAEAIGPRDPIEAEKAKLAIAGMRQSQGQAARMAPLEEEYRRAQIEQARQKVNPMKMQEVNGKIVGIMPDGTTKVLYDAGPNFDKLPEFAAKSAAFTSRMVDAEDNIKPLIAGRAPPTPDPKTGLPPLSRIDPNSGRSMTAFDPTSKETYALEKLPERLANLSVRAPEYQKYKQASEQWIRAFLRKESGAAIGKDEFTRDFIVYFPQPGDSPDVVQQKEKARQEVMKGFAGETRGFFDHVNPDGSRKLKTWIDGGAPQKPAAQTGQPAAPSGGFSIRRLD